MNNAFKSGRGETTKHYKSLNNYLMQYYFTHSSYRLGGQRSGTKPERNGLLAFGCAIY